MKRLINLLLVTMLLGLQAKWWLGQGGLREHWQLKTALASQRHENDTLTGRNQALAAEVLDLKNGTEALEERARNEFGLVEPNESFYQVVQHTLR